jgi:hypothetical protein
MLRLGILISISTVSLAAYLLQDTIYDPGKSAEFLVLISATLFVFSFFSGFWCLQRYLFIKRMERHVRGR